MNKSFKLKNGKVEMSNSEIFIKEKSFNKSDLKYNIKKLIIVTSIMLIYKYFFKEKLKNSSVWNNIYTGYEWFILGVFIIIFSFALFYYNFKKKLQINDIREVEIDIKSKVVEVTITNWNSKYKIIDFSSQDDEYLKFVDNLKKRNTRIIIETI